MDMNEARAIVIALANLDPEGMIDIEYGVPSDPSIDVIDGCRFCQEPFIGPREEWKHLPGCVWARARRALGAPEVRL